MRLIDADAARTDVWDHSTTPLNEWDTAGVLMMLNRQPTIDAEVVVRCRECEYAFKSGSSITGIRCEVWGTYDLFHACEPDWFCSHGKRKEGAD